MNLPFDSAGSLLLIHDQMISEELRRNNPGRHQRAWQPRRAGRFARLRRIAGRTLIDLGTRLDPSHAPDDCPVPAAHA